MPFNSQYDDMISYALALIEDHLEYMKTDDYYKEQGDYDTFLSYFDFMFCDTQQNPDGEKIIDFLKDQLDAGGEISTSSNLFKAIINDWNDRMNAIIPDVMEMRRVIQDEEETIEEEKEKYCQIIDCNELQIGGYLCKRHDCMFEKLVKDENLIEHAETITCHCNHPKCTNEQKTNIIIKLLKSLKDDRNKRVDIIIHEISKKMTVAQFEMLFASVVARLNVYGTMENIEKDVEAGNINEELYINICYYLKLVHEIKKEYIKV